MGMHVHKEVMTPTQRAKGDSPGGAVAAGTEQVLTVNNERFMVPEALFHPSDIGMNQAGAHLQQTVHTPCQRCAH